MIQLEDPTTQPKYMHSLSILGPNYYFNLQLHKTQSVLVVVQNCCCFDSYVSIAPLVLLKLRAFVCLLCSRPQVACMVLVRRE